MSPKVASKQSISMFAIYAVGSLAQSGLSLLLLPVYTQLFDATEYGMLCLLSLVVTFLSRIAVTPATAGIERFFYHPEFTAKRRPMVTSIFLIGILKLSLLGGGMVALSRVICTFVSIQEHAQKLLLAYAVFMVVSSTAEMTVFLVRLVQKPVWYVLAGLLRLLGTVGGVVIGHHFLKLGTVAFPFGLSVGAFLSLLTTGIPLRHHFCLRLNLGVCREPLAYAYPLILNGYSNLLIHSADRFVIARFGCLADVGRYTCGYQLSSVLQYIVAIPFKNLFVPKAMQRESDPEEQRRYIEKMAEVYLFTALVLFVVLSGFSREIIMLVTRRPEYWEGWRIVPFLAFAYVLQGLLNFSAIGITIARRSALQSGIVAVTAMLNLSLNLILVPWYGLSGAAVATIISYIFWNSVCFHFSRRLYNLHFSLKRFVGWAVLAAGAGSALLGAGHAADRILELSSSVSSMSWHVWLPRLALVAIGKCVCILFMGSLLWMAKMVPLPVRDVVHFLHHSLKSWLKTRYNGGL